MSEGDASGSLEFAIDEGGRKIGNASTARFARARARARTSRDRDDANDSTRDETRESTELGARPGNREGAESARESDLRRRGRMRALHRRAA